MEAGEGAAAKDDGADGAGGFVVGDAHVAAARIFLDGHFGDDRNAHSGANHAEDAAELATLENDLRIEAGTIARGDGGVAKAVTIAQQQERLLAEILERERTTAGEPQPSLRKRIVRSGSRQAIIREFSATELERSVSRPGRS